jgi:hypothetical protein
MQPIKLSTGLFSFARPLADNRISARAAYTVCMAGSAAQKVSVMNYCSSRRNGDGAPRDAVLAERAR